MNDLPHAIVCGCHKIGLGIIRALGEASVHVVGVYYNDMDMGYVSKYVVKSYRCPHPDHDDAGFISFLVQLADEWGGGILIPSDDTSLVSLSRHKDLLEKYYLVVASPWKITEQYINKKHTYNLAEKIGVPAPKTLTPAGLSEAINFSSKTGFPCLLKPSVGHRFYQLFKKKMILVHNVSQLREAYYKCAAAGTEMMIQEFIPGDDASGANYNSFFVRGVPLIEVTSRKVRLSPPRTGFPRVVVSKHIPELLAPGRKMLKALGFDGFSCMEFKRDARNGVYVLMEINGRLNLSTPLSVKAGINFPYYAYCYALRAELPEVAKNYAEDVYWIDIGKDMVESIRNYRTEQISLADYLKPYMKSNVYTVFSASDPLPFFKRCGDIAYALIQRSLNKSIAVVEMKRSPK